MKTTTWKAAKQQADTRPANSAKALEGVTRPYSQRNSPRRDSWDDLNPRRQSPLGMQNRIRIQVVGPRKKGGKPVVKQDVISEGNIMAIVQSL